MAHLRSEVCAAAQREALAPTVPARECAGGQPYLAPEPLMGGRLNERII